MDNNIPYRTELEKVLDYHIVFLYYPRIKAFRKKDLIEVVKQILTRYNLLKKYENIIIDYIVEVPNNNSDWSIDLTFVDTYQIKYSLFLSDNKLHKDLILDLMVQYQK